MCTNNYIYVCIRMRIYIYIYVYICTYTYACIYIYIHIHTILAICLHVTQENGLGNQKRFGAQVPGNIHEFFISSLGLGSGCPAHNSRRKLLQRPQWCLRSGSMRASKIKGHACRKDFPYED